MSYADHFSTIADRYAAYRPSYPPALVDALAEQTTPGTAWDVGCGSGQLAVGLAARFERVIATDPSEAQLAAAAAHPRVEYRCERAEATSQADASVDLVVVAQAAHWFAWPGFVAEATRVARPGALIALVSYGEMLVDEPAGALARYRDVVAPYWPPGREHVDTGYRDLEMPWPAVPARPIDMELAWLREELVGYVSTWSATALLVAQHGSAAFDALRAELAATWPDDERRIVRWPLAIRLARR
ncbi:MAG: class I SAM-dependent methyltransferase [Deltaproteobacteria bacterium]|nr:class I SAM-dependent methyltransferase [Deltaproteobacteria bacterium]